MNKIVKIDIKNQWSVTIVFNLRIILCYLFIQKYLSPNLVQTLHVNRFQCHLRQLNYVYLQPTS